MGLQTDGGFIECDHVILACGGCHIRQTGSDGGGLFGTQAGDIR